MNCELITIGDELLIGQVVDTNSAWMAARLNEAGISVKQISSVSDDSLHITDALKLALGRAKVILITGGLGPTPDDLTKETLCRFFNTKLIRNSKVLEDLELYFKSRGRDLTETNRQQADLPESCEPIYNRNGTAPGMWFDFHDNVIVSMPGVPYEMKGMMTEFVLPRLALKYKLPPVYHYTILTVGVGESFLSDILAPWEKTLPKEFKLAYLPATGTVRIRLSCYNSDPVKEKLLRTEAAKACALIDKYIFGYGDESLEAVAGSLLTSKGQTLAIAESCTGGYVSHLVTSVPGSSAYYIGSTISYANEVKSRFLDVDPNIISSKGAVSEEVAVAMARSVRSKLGATWALSTTGIAGPGGGSEEKPVGTVWIGIAGPDRAFARRFQFGTDRGRNIVVTAVYALNLLRKEILGLNE
jgi:nicotinamide-nucleotide amidase